MFYIKHSHTGMLADSRCTGEHNAIQTANPSEAKAFETWGDASEFNQNFGPDWEIEEY